MPNLRRGRDASSAALCIGRVGVLRRDDRDMLPFEVDFGGGALDFGMGEIAPAPDSTALQELPVAFSTAPPAQLGAAAALGGANLIGVLYLGSLLASTSAYPLAALGSSAPLIATLRRLYAPLAIYATGFLAIPAVRAWRTRRRNRRISARNEIRTAWGRALSSRPVGSLKRKLAAARTMRSDLKQLRSQDASFSSAKSIGEQRDPASDASFDEFDQRLAERMRLEEGSREDE
eukprot:CAMPEP_0181205726 /NCGR_PEP_ID=MMETSP1096-20121128/20634_1 /TAXON_ID=156174 ORGANISM="Chrysochromulina ericina, Strain CCMP281" /NCGR_SAMPLE_ID=MMETSP1096 /ASSEMBLY_ACC=CAM_ASM_000453 /LENGTH=232 /DNA_ID=CAMNT_0023296535 /DNA_START=1 /DNA_END=698 /DNA_ORIENTATION=-